MKIVASLTVCASAVLWAGSTGAEPVPEDAAARMQAMEERLEKLEERSRADTRTLQASWPHGLAFRSEDGAIRVHIGMRVQHDFAVVSGDEELRETVGPLQDGSKFRNARFGISGTLYEYGIFRAEYDFAGGSPAFRDVWVGLTDVPVLGTVRVGHMLEPYAMEQLSGIGFYHFMERGLPAAFYPFRSSGVTFNNTYGDQLGTWAIGAYQRVNAFGDFTTNSKYAATGRLTVAPVYADGGRRWLHVGVNYSYRKPDNETYAVAGRPESSVAPVFVRTGGVPSDRVRLAGGEIAATYGPLSLQAEAHMASVNLVETEEFPYSGDVDLSGYYLTAGYFLTGEHRRYSRNTGTMGRVIPQSNFRGEGSGLGAWEISVRHSELDLNDGPVEGGHVRNLSLGLSWYPNPNMRVIWNYVRADLKDAGKADIGQMRVQFDF